MQYIRSCPHVSRRGFSLIELLVAITLSLIMIAIIDRLFLDTTRAVGVGIGLNDIMNNGQTFYDQVQRDANKMLGPTSNGFLVIINKKYGYNSTAKWPLVENSRTGPQPADIRSDQLAFIIANAADDVPMTPGTPGNGAYYNAARASHSRVWYGHVTRTSNTSELHGLGTGLEIYANQWHLGRQQAFLAKGNLGTNTNNIATLDNANLCYAYTDVVNQVLSETTTGIKEILETAADYKATALGYTYGAKRLRFVARPAYDQTTPADSYNTNTIGPMHSDFLANASDFIVEFAGDLNNDGTIDHDSGQIRWYSGYPNGAIHPFPQDSDMVTPSTIRAYAANNVVYDYSTFDSKYQPLATAPALADHAFVWRHDNTQAFGAGVATDNCSWPYMIRIRIRLHDTKGDVVGSTLSNVKDTATDPVLVANRGKTIPGRWFEQIIKVPRP